MAIDIRRREFIITLGSAVAWPLAANAQQRERIRRVGILMSLAADDSEASRRVTAFVQSLQQLGWTDGRNMQIEYRWGGAIPSEFANMRLNSPRPHLMSFCPSPPRP